MPHERVLQRVQVARLAEALDRHDLVVLMHHGEREAGIDPSAVDQHRARPALTMVAALLRPRQSEMLAAQIEHRRTNIGLGVI
jgi:hypothetical protein